MVQGTTPTFLFKFSVNLDLINEWRICFAQEGKENLIKTNQDCVIDENQVIYVKLSQDETFAFDDSKYVKIKVKALTKDNNVITSQTIKMFVCEMLDKVKFDVENTPPQIIDTSTINFEFDTEPCGFGLDFENLFIETVGGGGGGDSMTVDSQLSTTSKNPVQNKVISTEIAKINENHSALAYDYQRHKAEYEQDVDNIGKALGETKEDVAKAEQATNVLSEQFYNHKQQYEQTVNTVEEMVYGHGVEISQLKTGKQDKLTFDTTPTQGSSNPVTSGGVYTVIGNISSALTELHNYAETLKGGGE